MKKKVILITIISIYLSFIILTPIISAAPTAEITLETDAEIETPLKIGEQKEIELNVKYQLVLGDIAKLFFGRRIIRFFLFGLSNTLKISGDPSITLNLSLESPEWCTANLEPTELMFTMDKAITDGKTKTVKLTYIIDENATALVNESIKINANSNGVGSVPESSNTFPIQVVPEYKSDIITESKNEFTIPPLKNYSVLVNITNNGNGETSVSFEIEKPKDWNVSFSPEEIIIPATETKQVTVNVINPPKSFENETLIITMNPKSTIEDYEGDEKDKEGTPVTLSLTFLNDGSADNSDDEIGIIDITLLIVILLAVLIIIIIIFYVRKRFL